MTNIDEFIDRNLDIWRRHALYSGRGTRLCYKVITENTVKPHAELWNARSQVYLGIQSDIQELSLLLNRGVKAEG